MLDKPLLIYTHDFYMCCIHKEFIVKSLSYLFTYGQISRSHVPLLLPLKLNLYLNVIISVAWWSTHLDVCYLLISKHKAEVNIMIK